MLADPVISHRPVVEELDEVWTRNVEQVRGLLRSELHVHRYDSNGIALSHLVHYTTDDRVYAVGDRDLFSRGTDQLGLPSAFQDLLQKADSLELLLLRTNRGTRLIENSRRHSLSFLSKDDTSKRSNRNTGDPSGGLSTNRSSVNCPSCVQCDLRDRISSARAREGDMNAQVLRAQQLPAGVVLATGENLIGRTELLASNIFWYLKLKLVLTNRRLAGERPNTALALLPIGSEKISYPLSNIAGVDINTRLAVGPFLIGVVLGLVGIAEGLTKGGWFFILLGVVVLLYSYRAFLVIRNSGGGVIMHRISVFNRSLAQEFATSVNTAIAEHGR
jgi:hypothetical protein